MTTRVGGALPELLQTRLHPDTIERVSRQAVLLLTVSEGQPPHVAIVSHFELLAPDDRHILILLYEDSSTARNLRTSRLATLVFTDRDVVFMVKGSTAELSTDQPVTPSTSLFCFEVEDVLTDQADEEREGAVQITGGVTWDSDRLADRMQAATTVFRDMKEAFDHA